MIRGTGVWLRVFTVCVMAGVLPAALRSQAPSSSASPGTSSAQTTPGTWMSTSFPTTSDWPRGTVAEANALVAEAVAALNKGAGPAIAFPLLERAVEADPRHPFAWWRLGSLQAAVGPHDVGRANMRRQIEVAPSAPAYRHAAFILHTLGSYAEAIPIWKEGIERFPDDRQMPPLFGETLLASGDAAGAASILEAELEHQPDSSRIRLFLGRAYARTDREEEAVAQLRRASELEPVPDIWIAVATALVAMNRGLDVALDNAQRAVTSIEQSSSELKLPEAAFQSAGLMTRLYRAWDTMAAVYERLAQYEQARDYAEATWQFMFQAADALRVGRIEQALKNYDAAAQFYALASVGPVPHPSAQAYLAAFAPDVRSQQALLSEANAIRRAAVQFTVDRPEGVQGQGQFVALTNDIGEVFSASVAGTFGEAGAAVARQLAQRRIGPVVPGDGVARVVVRGRIDCPAESDTCTATLMPPQAVVLGGV